MQKSIHERLVENQQFKKMATADVRYYDLVPRISKRAQGVWLWVYLVVRDLLRDRRDSEPYEQLVARLKSYPRELAAYYQVMMNRIDAIHKRESAQIMLLALASPVHMSLFVLKHLSRWKDPDLISTTPQTPIDNEEVEALYQQWLPRLQNRCRDLLQIGKLGYVRHTGCRYHVDFLHRTVRDFLFSKYQTTLRHHASEDFDEAFVQARASIFMLKIAAVQTYTRSSSRH